MKKEAANFILEHVFLPPKVSQSYHDEAGADELLKKISQAAHEFADSFSRDSSERRIWAQLRRSISKWIDLYDNGEPCISKIINSLDTMLKDDVLLFYIKPQNAAIIVRNKSRGAIFECFEVLARTDAVLKATDALIRRFPARAVFLPEEKLRNTAFTRELGGAIHKLSVEKLKIAIETTRKANNTVVEERQSAHPRAVTEWLFGVLGSCGNAVPSHILCKRVHDDVLWKNTNLPWRRSGVWLSARVALQIALVNAELEGEGHGHYKNFIFTRRSSRPTSEAGSTNAKLGSSTFGFVQTATDEALSSIDNDMQRQWTEVVLREKVNVQPVAHDLLSTELLLTKSSPILRHIWERAHKGFAHVVESYSPPTTTEVTLPIGSLPTPAIFERPGDLLSCLVGFEFWIEENLGSWSVANTGNPSACRALLELLPKYHALAKRKYESHPERLSIMLLVMFELWIALDTIATTAHPLLLDYPPEIPSILFGPLLLSKRADLERLSRIELHIKSRDLRELRLKVEQETQKARDDKLVEWESKKQKYDKLMGEVEAMECGIWIPRGIDRWGKPYVGKPRHDRRCQKCAKEKEAKAMEISKHEWALPDNETLCKAVVFELGAPPALVSWRDATFYLVQDVGRSQAIEGPSRQQNLLTYPPLKRHTQHAQDRRVTLGSAVKSMLKSHYIRSSLNVDPVIVNNGLVPKMCDTSKSNLWTAEQTGKLSLQRYCYVKLSEPWNEHLGRYVNFTLHTTNSVIARQSVCPPEMGPHEAVYFGSLRSGERLQILNILGALMSLEVDLNSPAIAVLFRYAICQVGTPRTKLPLYLRESQTALEDEHISQSLLNALEVSFSKIEPNFKEVSTAAVLLGVCLNILSLTPVPKIATRCANLNFKIRQAALAWIRQMTKLRTDQKNARADTGALKDLSRQILIACLLCRRTFALDNDTQ
ncbi:hypothetical protein A1O7_04625 [Cladophialophora yegresii CBS 114405]|uniref:DUF6606 domain-containing protein n=1 Tax=Cladophialophora yegresii CBS 114405 TaxID=1182544 RepID=W9VXB0_9EURO|nr:uncharacterized protein A1O7_04625 [Cladophialophora yegresii CBS 114405]EXJ60472.1 hypothetical protein A1O7_04625 [Cladophialophora yegresii CBS 114405]